MKRAREVCLAGTVATALLTGGCGQIAYKTGAGADALQADEDACRQGATGTVSVQSCMKAKGWAIADLDGGPSVAAVPAGPVASATPGASSAPSAAMPDATIPTPPAAPATVDARPRDPLGQVPVTGWVRFGGGGPQDDIAGCVASLGPDHRPDMVHHTVTTALVSCMRGKGWRAI